jgi:hypothetical protein
VRIIDLRPRDRKLVQQVARYEKLGYVVGGVLPDANGRGRPDIFMARQVTR